MNCNSEWVIPVILSTEVPGAWEWNIIEHTTIYNDKKARKNNSINLGQTPRGAEAINYSKVKGKYFWETQDKEATGHCISIKTITKGNWIIRLGEQSSTALSKLWCLFSRKNGSMLYDQRQWSLMSRYNYWSLKTCLSWFAIMRILLSACQHRVLEI